MTRWWIVAVMVLGLAGPAQALDLLAGDLDTVPLSDINPAVWEGSDQNPSLRGQLVNANPTTEEAWGEAILGFVIDLGFIDRHSIDGDQTSLAGYNPGFGFEYAVVKYANIWALYADSDTNDLLDVGPLRFGISHVTFFHNSPVAVPEVATVLLMGMGFIALSVVGNRMARQ